LYERLHTSGTVLINIFPEKKENLIRATTASRESFKHIALIEFNEYQNIVLILSKVALPTKEQLISNNNKPYKLLKMSFEEHINNIHYVPVKVI
jgi:spermidine synthase